MNKILTILGLNVIIVMSINMIHLSGDMYYNLLGLLIGCWFFISGILEELKRLFDNLK